MFLKSVNAFFSKTGSITSRLTVFYTLSTLALLTVVCFFSYWAMIKIVYKGDYTFLSDEMDLLQEVVTQHHDNLSILKIHTIDIPHALSGSIYRFYVRIKDDKNNVILATPNSNVIFNNKKNNNLPLLSRKTYWQKSINNDDYLLMEAKIPTNSLDHLTIQIALNVSYQHVLISNYRNHEYLKLIIVILLIGGIFAILLGYTVARRSLKRLYEIADTTKKITVTSLDQRLNTQLWPKELNELGLSFNYMLDRIECSFSRLKQFSADLAHEICTPINNLMGQTELMLSRQFPAAELAPSLESNLEELHRVTQIIENILFLARTDNMSSNLKKESLDVHKEISAVRDYYQVVADEKNIKITCQGSATIFANSIMFRRAISNIFSNALKYSLQGGQIFCEYKETSKHIEITIRDIGIGIASEHLNNISNRFYRVNSDRSSQSGGVGLGLAIVKSIVELHQGTLSIFSEIHKGTTVKLIFPK